MWNGKEHRTEETTLITFLTVICEECFGHFLNFIQFPQVIMSICARMDGKFDKIKKKSAYQQKKNNLSTEFMSDVKRMMSLCTIQSGVEATWETSKLNPDTFNISILLAIEYIISSQYAMFINKLSRAPIFPFYFHSIIHPMLEMKERKNFIKGSKNYVGKKKFIGRL